MVRNVAIFISVIIMQVKIKPEFVLFFDCPEEELTRRILNRNQVSLMQILVAESLPMHLFTTFSVFLKGRVDDNIETIGKRLKVYFESTLPVINYYNSKGKVQKVFFIFLSEAH